MIRRLIVALVALLIAAVGGVLTYLYAAGADSRAMARMTPTQVLVVAEPIEAGTAADAIARSVVVSEIPQGVVVPGAVTDLADVAGLIASTDLLPGEQLLASRFVEPETLDGEFEVPLDMHQLSIQLDRQRVIGGELRPGQTVAVFVSGTVTGSGPDGSDAEADMTRLLLHKVLVTAVHGGSSITTDESGEEVEEAAADTLIVTLALSAADSELVVFSQEFGSVWLSLEGAEVPEGGTRVVTPEEVFG
ncbi:Flp pilus assembly protein CpaB [Agrococcus sediminis]|uniref:Flp pilus assembly protein CpaB n=1 Tax=Agrococcus sediminis TaxID=2599924 RepID=A0A5M8QAP7_9MICO|nr:Flp pilus assembly protein CpaB [Agrococcus sediminis]KAA6432111.1 Flp pilus assembly protein CpaB [Agrococcus sediminis]